jgi:hypothetical protein
MEFIQAIFGFLIDVITYNDSSVVKAVDPLTGMAIAGVVGGGLQKLFGYGNAKRNEQKALRELAKIQSQPLAQYSQSQGMRELGQIGANEYYNPQGFTQGETDAAMQDIARASNTAYQRGINLGGGQMSRSIQGLNTANTLSALNRFGSQGAALRRQMQGRGLGTLRSTAMNEQQLDNQNVGTSLQRRLMGEQAAGRAVMQQRDLAEGTLNALGSDLLGMGATLGMGKLGMLGGSGGNPNYTALRTQRGRGNPSAFLFED